MSQDSIVNALAEISPQFRDVVVLVDIGDFTYADAAQILDMPIGTVMSRLHRGRRARSKQKLAEEIRRVDHDRAIRATSARSSSRSSSTARSRTTSGRRRSRTSRVATTAGAATASRRRSGAT